MTIEVFGVPCLLLQRGFFPGTRLILLVTGPRTEKGPNPVVLLYILTPVFLVSEQGLVSRNL